MHEAIQRLSLEPLGETTWRLCDTSFAESDARRIVAFVERMPHGTYEVTWVVPQLGVQRLSRIDDVLREALAWIRLDGSRGARHTKPIPIPHLPPASGTMPV